MAESADHSDRSAAPTSGEEQHEDFVRIFAETNHRIYAFVATLVPHRTDTDEVFQKTSVILWRKFSEFDPKSDFVAWACRVAQFEVMNFRRTEGRRPVVFDASLIADLAEEKVAAEPLLLRRTEAMEECLDDLPPGDRELIRKCYAEGAKIKHVAERLGSSVHTQYKNLARIRRSLRICIDGRVEEEGDL